MRASTPSGSTRFAGALVLLSLCGACCVAPPSAKDLFAVGFRTPEQAFATFQTAVRADDPGLERGCLSADFIARNSLSEQVFRTFWEQLEKDQPFLRKGIADARIEGPADVRRDRARLRAKTHGRSLVIDLRREDFCEAYGGGEKLADESAPFSERTGVQNGENGSRWFYGRMALPAGLAAERVTELRFGREWKIDDFRVVDEKAHETPRDDRSSADGLP